MNSGKGTTHSLKQLLEQGYKHILGIPSLPKLRRWNICLTACPSWGDPFCKRKANLVQSIWYMAQLAPFARVMTSTSGPGTSLMMEGLSYIASTEVLIVLVDVVRGGPGLGTIAPSQQDYNQVVHGGGHGDYHLIVLAPAGVQETVDIVYDMFDIAEKYLTIGVIMIDGSIGQMMEPAEMPPMLEVRKDIPDWAVRGGKGKDRRVLTSIHFAPEEMEKTNMRMMKRWQQIEKNEVQYKEYFMDGAKIAVIGYGSAGRIALSAVRTARSQGIPVGLVRPISLSPFPKQLIREVSEQVDSILVVEMNSGMMLEDVLCAVQGKTHVKFYGRMGGVIPFPDEILKEIYRISKGPQKDTGHPRDLWLKCMDSIVQ